ncbi:MAG TPA: HlyD family efflux transporter periplasmic adaptor subunit [Candidatus Saccharimonadales bacterium]|nr:HlyD family efflux transporter periplasmic adaptor subunit [Candidatus Saccharimonadales bacterium]
MQHVLQGENQGQSENQGRNLKLLSYSAVLLAAALAVTIGVSRMKSAPPVVGRSDIKVATVQRGPLVRKVQGLGVLVPEEVRWLAAATPGHVDQIFARAGARVKPDTVILQLSNPDLDRQLVDAELATKKAEAELANLRVQLQVQLLTEKALEAQLQSDTTEAKLQSDRDEALQKMALGTAMNAKISRARADSLGIRVQIETEKLAIAEEARQAQLAAKQAEVAQVQALYTLKIQQKEALQVRAGISGVLEEVTVDAGQQVAVGTNLARVTGSARLMARIHIPESQSRDIQLNQKAQIGVQDRPVAGRVLRIDPGVQNGSVNVDVKMEGAQPAGARTDLTVDGTIDVDRVPDAVYVGPTLEARPNSHVSLFKLSTDGKQARRVSVNLGQVSTDGVEIVDGLQAGDRIIVSDMSTWNRYDTVQVR